MLEEFYEKEIRVCQFDCDFNNRIKLGAVLRQVQQISEDHCNAIGLTDEKYAQSHTAFILSKLSVTILGEIFANDKVRLITKPYYPSRAVYTRKTSLYDASGNCVYFIDAKWVLIDTDTKRILRKPPESFVYPFSKKADESPANIEMKPMLTGNIGALVATYSQIDRNGHVNNASYADIICDHLPMGCFCEKPIQKMIISYHREVRLGEEVQLFMSDFDEMGQSYFCGKVNGNTCFEANIAI